MLKSSMKQFSRLNNVLPGTGGMGNKLFVLIGVGLMGAAAGAFLLRRKFKNQ